MAGYIIARINITDMDRYREYMKLTPAAIAAAGGKFLARGGEVTTLEGPEETHRVVLLEFPTVEAAKAFYHGDGYAAARALRAGAAEAQFIALAGV